MLTISEVDEMKNSLDWTGKRILVIGVARQGIALARYLIHHGAEVILNDKRQLHQLTEAQDVLGDESIQWVTGGHPLSILERIDLVSISGGVPSDLPIVVEATKRGIPVSNDSQIFLDVCPCKVIGITGSAGKTTTTTLFGLIAQAAINEMKSASLDEREFGPSISTIQPGSKVWVGGNIGSPLIAVADQIQTYDLAVMELSSLQLEVMESSPDVAVILNITPNHLDRHKTMENYIAAKSRIIEFQTSQDYAVLNMEDEITRALLDDINGRLVSFGLHDMGGALPRVFFAQDSQSVQIQHSAENGMKTTEIIRHKEIPLRGEHNLMNVIAACAIALACGISPTAMKKGIKLFRGIPHRLEFVRSWGGGDWYNDSIATAPERATAAINSFSEPMILLAGGRDKDLPWDNFASLVCDRVKHLILFGEAAGIISEALERQSNYSKTSITTCSGLEDAVEAAASEVSEGDVVLLSPGGTSFDEFLNFEERGEAFKKWVMELA